MSVESFKSDEELLSYALTHAETPRALFQREQFIAMMIETHEEKR